LPWDGVGAPGRGRYLKDSEALIFGPATVESFQNQIESKRDTIDVQVESEAAGG
jgi:hypothetical protein